MRTLLAPLTLLSLALSPAIVFAQGPEQPTPTPNANPNANPNAPSTSEPPELLRSTPGGLTSDQVAEKAVATSYTAKASDEALKAAAERADAAWAQFIPRASVLARYTRLSEITPGTVVIPPNSFFPGSPGSSFSGAAFAPVILDNWTFQGTLAVPISDYFLRIAQSYSAATLSRDAARYDLAAAKAKAASDGRITYYQWLRARGSQAVAEQNLENAKTHYKDAQNIFTVGRASKADVLNAETRVASAELALERTKNLIQLTETQVRVAMHEPGDAPLNVGEDLRVEPAPFQGSLSQLVQEAISARMELKSLEANVAATHKSATATRNAMFPQFAGVANLTVANPNQRKFPLQNTFFPTWDVSLQLTWSPNDILIYGANASSIDAQADQLDAQRSAVKDGIVIEVTQAYQALKEAEFALDTTKRGLASAREAYRVARELFVNGTATSTTLTDAETQLTGASLERLNALVDTRIGRVRLEHALGRDAKLSQ